MDNVTKAYKHGLDSIKGRLMGSHQHNALKWMLQNEIQSDTPGGVLALDMGLGKTYVTSATIRANPKPATLLVVPISIIHQWRDILKSFGNIDALILDRQLPIKQLPQNTNVVITTYSMFSHKPKKGYPPIIKNTHWDRVILDEGHTIKNAGGSTFSNVCKLNSTIKWVVTATPVQNSLRDLAALMKWINFKGDQDDFIKAKLLRQTMDEVGKINPRMQLPKLDSAVIKLGFMTSRELELYKKIENEFQTRIEKSEKGTKLYTDALEGILRCRQACCHPEVYLESLNTKKRKRYDPTPIDFTSTKFKYVLDDLKRNPKDKAIIFCIWTKEINMLTGYLNDNDISTIKFDGKMTREQRERAIYNFNQTDIRVLVIQINTVGVGLNLQAATRVYINSPTWNPCQELQAIARSHRLGQEQIVKCMRLVIEDSIEERIMQIQNNKLSIIAECFDEKQVFEKMGMMESLSKTDVVSLFR